MTVRNNPIVGLIPAAGKGSRLGRLPFSKELLPIGFAGVAGPGRGVLVAIENAIASLVENGVTRQHVIIAPGKWDIPAYLGDGSQLEASISYLIADASPSVPHSLDVAHRFVESCEVVLIFPDIVFQPRDAISELVTHRARSGADVALALVPSDRGDKVDIVSCNSAGDVMEIIAKPGADISGWTWVAANWNSKFTAFLHAHLRQTGRPDQPRSQQELYVADILTAAISAGFTVQAVKFPDGDAIDIGTPDDLSRAWLRDN